MIFKRTATVSALALASAAVVGCSSLGFGAKSTTYEARLYPLNSHVTGAEANGTATIEVDGDNVIVAMDMAGVPASTEHWQHLHGFTSGESASCAKQTDDANGDGIVDLTETERASGTTMVPLDSAPAQMDVAHGTYPTAAADGTYHYRQEIPLKALQKSFANSFDGQKLDLDQRVIYVHGVPAATNLPGSVASLDPVPAHVTLPIACGKLVKR